MKPPSQGGRGCRVKLVMLVLIGLFTVAQGVLPGQTEDIDRHQERLAADPGPTDDHEQLLARHGALPVPDQQQHACSKAPPPLRGPSCNESKPSLRGHHEHDDPGMDPHHERRLKRPNGPRVLPLSPDILPCPGQLTKALACNPPCQAGTLCGGSKPVSHSVPVPGTSLLPGSTGTTSPPLSITMNHHGHFGPSLELDPGSTKQLAVSDTRRGDLQCPTLGPNREVQQLTQSA